MEWITFVMIESTMIEVCYITCSDYRLHENVNKFGLYNVEYVFLFGMFHVGVQPVSSIASSSSLTNCLGVCCPPPPLIKRILGNLKDHFCLFPFFRSLDISSRVLFLVSGTQVYMKPTERMDITR